MVWQQACQFELDGPVNYEFCEGELGGKPVQISRPWEDMSKGATPTLILGVF